MSVYHGVIGPPCLFFLTAQRYYNTSPGRKKNRFHALRKLALSVLALVYMQRKLFELATCMACSRRVARFGLFEVKKTNLFFLIIG